MLVTVMLFSDSNYYLFIIVISITDISDSCDIWKFKFLFSYKYLKNKIIECDNLVITTVIDIRRFEYLSIYNNYSHDSC